jgi:hypothetical protein
MSKRLVFVGITPSVVAAVDGSNVNQTFIAASLPRGVAVDPE